LIDAKLLFNILKKNDVNFFAGVPDSILKNFSYVLDSDTTNENHIICANEGLALSTACGYYLSSGKIPLVYLQNSGFGKLINPLLSLAHNTLYSIPIIILMGHRGCSDFKDEPQHQKQGRVTEELLKLCDVYYEYLTNDTNKLSEQINALLYKAIHNKMPVCLLVKRNTLSNKIPNNLIKNKFSLGREFVIRKIVENLDTDDIVISSTGMISRELSEIRSERGEYPKDFLNVGAMGHASSIALGISIQKSSRRVYCIDGDGSVLMHMGSLPINSQYASCNFKHIVLNNNSHDSVGSQPTIFNKVSLSSILKSCGYKILTSVDDNTSLDKRLYELKESKGPTFLEINVKNGSRSNLGRPADIGDNLRNFIKHVNS